MKQNRGKWCEKNQLDNKVVALMFVNVRVATKGPTYVFAQNEQNTEREDSMMSIASSFGEKKLKKKHPKLAQTC